MGVKNVAQIFTASIPDELGHKAGHHRKIQTRRPKKKNPEVGTEMRNIIYPFLRLRSLCFTIPKTCFKYTKSEHDFKSKQ